MRGAVWYAGCSGYRLQRLILLKVWLEHAEAIKCKFSASSLSPPPVDPYPNSMPNNVDETMPLNFESYTLCEVRFCPNRALPERTLRRRPAKNPARMHQLPHAGHDAGRVPFGISTLLHVGISEVLQDNGQRAWVRAAFFLDHSEPVEESTIEVGFSSVSTGPVWNHSPCEWAYFRFAPRG